MWLIHKVQDQRTPAHTFSKESDCSYREMSALSFVFIPQNQRAWPPCTVSKNADKVCAGKSLNDWRTLFMLRKKPEDTNDFIYPKNVFSSTTAIDFVAWTQPHFLLCALFSRNTSVFTSCLCVFPPLVAPPWSHPAVLSSVISSCILSMWLVLLVFKPCFLSTLVGPLMVSGGPALFA